MKKFILSSFLVLLTITSFQFFINPSKTYAAPCSGTCVIDDATCLNNKGKIITGDCEKTYPKCCDKILVGITKSDNIRITDIGKLIGALISAVFVIAGLIAFVFLIWGGIQWITSGGDKTGVEAAQKRIQAALIGLIIVVASWAIMSLVARFLGIDIFNLNFQTPF